VSTVEGKQLRLARILGADRSALIVPLDHALTLGPIPGLVDIGSLVQTLSAAQPDALIVHRGVLSSASWDPTLAPRIIMHLSGNSTFDEQSQVKALVASVEDAVRLGADGVSVHVSLGTDHDRSTLAEVGAISSASERYGLPLLAMMYVSAPGRAEDATAIAHAARIGAELGADIVKVNAPRDPADLASIFAGCYVPVLLAGGEANASPLGTLELIERGMASGGAGACVGRNVFQAPDPFSCVRALRDVIHGGVASGDAFDRWLRPGVAPQPTMV
jgi:class I fructose-bisphosphate aldolase